MSKVLQALPPPEQSQASQALPTACPPALHCRQLPPTVVALYNWAGLCPVRRSWPLWTGAKPRSRKFAPGFGKWHHALRWKGLARL
jgi:hypothetical protein